jgi:hypothetical protein
MDTTNKDKGVCAESSDDSQSSTRSDQTGIALEDYYDNKEGDTTPAIQVRISCRVEDRR